MSDKPDLIKLAASYDPDLLGSNPYTKLFSEDGFAVVEEKDKPNFKCPKCGEETTFDTGWVQVKGIAKYRDTAWHPGCFRDFYYTDEGRRLS